jgi:6-phosphofructo-2-kinase/fructose-2,6-biphosphatase 2
LEPIILELERHYESNHSIFIIGHQAVLRAIYSYFMNLSHTELPYVEVPLHTIIKLTPKAYGCVEERFPVDIPAVDTHRPRGSGRMSRFNSSPSVMDPLVAQAKEVMGDAHET